MTWNIVLFVFVTIILFLTSIFNSTFAVQLLNTSSGIYVGQTVIYDDVIVRQYLGIQYGQADKRFGRARLVVRKNNRIINATSFGPSCKPTEGACGSNSGNNSTTPLCSINYGIFSLKSSVAEQCLYLNAFVPVTPNKKEKKAIYMWIHGGSGQVGTGSLFDGTMLAAAGDIIVITFNFRLNLFGFLSTGDERLEGNLGLYDQALALDWVYKNADSLGGDVKRITVGGHSAGAPHAYYLAKSPLNRGRIARLILQSGSPFNVWSHLKAREAIEKFDIVANDNGCGTNVTWNEKFKCLQERDFNTIAEYEHHSYTSANHTNVVITGNYMSEFRENFEENDTLANVDILMGSTDDEGIYVAVVPILMEQQNQDVVAANTVNFTAITFKFLAAMQPDRACLYHKALEYYHIDNIPENCSQTADCYCAVFYNYSQLITDILFNIDYYRFIKERVKYSNRTFIYQYSHHTAQEHPSTCNEYLHNHGLVGHFAELEYTWGTPLLFDINKYNHNATLLIKYARYSSNLTTSSIATNFYTDEEIQFSRQLMEQWSNFIKYGQPKSSTIQDEWPAITDMSTASIMNLKFDGSEVKKLIIPPGVKFWTDECPTEIDTNIIKSNNGSSLHNISLVMFVLFLLSSNVLNLLE